MRAAVVWRKFSLDNHFKILLIVEKYNSKIDIVHVEAFISLCIWDRRFKWTCSQISENVKIADCS